MEIQQCAIIRHKRQNNESMMRCIFLVRQGEVYLPHSANY